MAKYRSPQEKSGDWWTINEVRTKDGFRVGGSFSISDRKKMGHFIIQVKHLLWRLESEGNTEEDDYDDRP